MSTKTKEKEATMDEPTGAAPAQAMTTGNGQQAAAPRQQTQEYNPFLEYGESVAPRNIAGTLLKFNKGDWLAGQEMEEIPVGKRFIANMNNLLIGWIRWEDQRPAEQQMGLLVEGYQPAKRDTLGYGYLPGQTEEEADKSEWEVDATSGQPRDPFQFSNYLVLKDPDVADATEGIYTFATSSTGGLAAIGELCKIYGRKGREHPDEFPIVALKVGSYMHSNKAFGRIKIPVLAVVGWAPKELAGEITEGNSTPLERLAGPLTEKEEEIPF